MSESLARARTISIRLPERLATALDRAAVKEGNPPSAVARRLIGAGLAREQQPVAETTPPVGDHVDD